MQGLKTNWALAWDREALKSIQFEVDASGRVIQKPEHRVIVAFAEGNSYLKAKIQMSLSLEYPEDVPEGRDVFTVRLDLNWKAKQGRAELVLIVECDSLEAVEESFDDFDTQLRLMLRGRNYIPGANPAAAIPFITIRGQMSDLFVLLNGLLATRLADRKRVARNWRIERNTARKMKKAMAQSP